MTTAWFHCLAGVSGDMMLGALVDAGAPLDDIQQAVDAVGAGPLRLSCETVTRHALGALKVRVHAADTAQHRGWREIRQLLEQAALADPVRERALAVFERLARAEAAVHRIDPEDVHFHEVGAMDTIADVVGSCAALHALGISSVSSSPVALGSGTVRAAHGVLPVPVPAVVHLLAEVGAPVYAGPVRHEMCTPTGAALLAAHCESWNELPLMRPRATGLGAGDRDFTEVPNVLRVVLGDPVDAVRTSVARGPRRTEAVQMETNVDDLDPRLWPEILERLLAAGASDAWLVPVLMKKGRPAHTLCVLAPADRVDALSAVIFAETSTIGLRYRTLGKLELDREVRTVDVDGTAIRVKTAELNGVQVNAQPEYADVLAASRALGRPLKEVLNLAIARCHEAGVTGPVPQAP